MRNTRMLTGMAAAGALMLAAFVAWALAGPLLAGPRAADGITLPYVGRLTDAQGLPVADGDYDFRFALHAAVTGGEALWQEIQATVPVMAGSFSVAIGGTAGIPEAVLDGEETWLAVAVRGPGETDFTTLAPRQRISATTMTSPNVSAAAGMACPHTHWGEDWSGSGAGLQVHSSSSYALHGSSGSAGWAWVGGVGPVVKAVAMCSDCVGVEGRSLYGHGVYGNTDGDYGWRSGVYGRATKDHANGVTGWNEAGGPGVYGYGQSGSGVHAQSQSGVALMVKGAGVNLIEAWDAAAGDRRFLVSKYGTVRADTGYYTPAGDFAEMMPAAEGLEPGDVLAIGIDGRLVRSTLAFQTSVVGVYSTEPGFVGGYRDDGDQMGRVPLAVIGVVPVKASAENGAIAPGDLLVASSVAGHAMRAGADPPQGTVIGKALSELSQGTGTVTTLVTLQ